MNKNHRDLYRLCRNGISPTAFNGLVNAYPEIYDRAEQAENELLKQNEAVKEFVKTTTIYQDVVKENQDLKARIKELEDDIEELTDLLKVEGWSETTDKVFSKAEVNQNFILTLPANQNNNNLSKWDFREKDYIKFNGI